MKKFLIVLCLSLASSFAFAMGSANQFGVAAGLHTNSADSGTTGTSVDSKTSFQVGGLGIFDTGSLFGIRAGFFYTQRNFDFSTLTADGDVKLTYFDVPVTALFKFNEWGGAFIGPVFALNVADSCTISVGSCDADPKSLNVGLQLGATYRFAPFVGAEVYYELLPGSLSSDSSGFKDYKSIGANLVVYFD